MKARSGFTMLELVMVVIIIGVLAALALPQYTSFVERARSTEATNTVGAIKSAESLFRLETGAYTATLADLGITVPTGANAYWTYEAAVTAAGFTVTATRTARNAAGHTGETMIYTWDDATGTGVWGAGNYDEVEPR